MIIRTSPGRTVARRVAAVRTLAVGALLLGAAGAGSLARAAEPSGPVVYEGTVAGSRVVMLLEPATDNRLRGVYLYRSVGRDVPIDGTRREFSERDPSRDTNPDAKVTAVFRGAFTSDAMTFAGTWTAAGGKTPQPVSLRRVAFTPGAASVKVRAAVRTVKGPNGPATYRLPEITGTRPDWIGRRIMGDFTAAALADLDLEQVVKDFRTNGLGITGLDYQVLHDGDGLLDLRFQSETLGAYPDGYALDCLYATATGERLDAADFFTRAGMARLRRVVDERLAANAAAALKASPDEADDLRSFLDDVQSSSLSDAELGTFSLADGGLVFHHDWGFPHVAQALEPDGEVRVGWDVVRGSLKPGSLLTAIAGRS